MIILVSHRNEVDYRVWRDWFRLSLQKPDGTTWLEMRGLSLVTSRNGLVTEALKSDAEYLFFVDDDIIAPGNIIPVLMGHSRPIACGLYWAKKKKAERCLAAWMKVPAGYAAIAPQQNGSLIQVDVTGLGCALVHRSVFEKISQPWFDWKYGGPSEDFYFYEKAAAEAGIKPVVDMSMACRHIGTFSIEPDGSFETLEI